MSFYSYKNGSGACCRPGSVSNASVTNGLTERICVQVKNVYDSCLSQDQLTNRTVTVGDIVPIVPGGCANGPANPLVAGCRCSCNGDCCACTCRSCGAPLSYEEALENAQTSPVPLPTPQGNWTFESCRSSTTRGAISDLSIERLCDRPQYGRVRANISVPIDVLFIDAACQEWMGQATLTVAKDVLLAIPDESIVPFCVESLVSAICVSGSYIGDRRFQITICVTIVLKIIAEVEVMIPSYGFCEIPPAEEFAENVCDEFFSLPLFPQQSPAARGVSNGNGSTATAAGCCGCSTCSSCGTVCGGSCSSCPRCGCAMTATT